MKKNLRKIGFILALGTVSFTMTNCGGATEEHAEKVANEAKEKGHELIDEAAAAAKCEGGDAAAEEAHKCEEGKCEGGDAVAEEAHKCEEGKCEGGDAAAEEAHKCEGGDAAVEEAPAEEHGAH